MLLPSNKITAQDIRAVRQVRKARHEAFDAAEPEPVTDPALPVATKPGTRFAPPVPRGSGPRKRFAAN